MSNNRLFKGAALVAGLALVGVGAAGCESGGQALGFSKVTPDEFRVVAKAPLVVPPDYALRPPSPGEPRPQELAPESAARQALMGARENVDRSQGEALLAKRAGGDKADPLVRYVVDDEFGAIAHKDKSFADRVMFWKGDSKAPAPVAAGADSSDPIDPALEQKKIRSLTGQQDIIIARQPTGKKLKLPGL